MIAISDNVLISLFAGVQSMGLVSLCAGAHGCVETIDQFIFDRLLKFERIHIIFILCPYSNL